MYSQWTTGNALNFGELITARKYALDTGNTTRALSGGITPSANLNSIDL